MNRYWTRRLAMVGALILAWVRPALGVPSPARQAAPFVCDADLDLYTGNDRATVVSAGGPVTFYARGLRGVRAGGRALEVLARAPSLLRVALPAGRHAVELVRDGSVGALPVPASTPAWARTADVSTPEAFEAAQAGLGPGKTLVLKNGVYRDFKVTITANGEPSRPVVIRPQTPGGVLFMGRTSIRLKGDYVVLREFRFCHSGTRTLSIDGRDNNRVTQCQFEQCGAVDSPFGHILRIGWRSDSNRIDHCYFANSKAMSVGQAAGRNPKPGEKSGVGTYNRVDRNIFRDIYRMWRNGQEAIQIGQGQGYLLQTHMLVEQNLFENTSGDSEIISVKTSNNTIRHNVMANCYATLTMRGGHDNLFDGNLLRNNRNGIRLYGHRNRIVNNVILNMPGAGVSLASHAKGEKAWAATDALIAHNTFVDCRRVVSGPGTNNPTAAYPTNNLLVNNICVGPTGTLLRVKHPSHLTPRNNLLWARGQPLVAPIGEGVVRQDPRLTARNGIPYPSAGSPAQDAAIPMAPPLRHDFWGRPRGARPDLGGIELNGHAHAAELRRMPPLPPLAKTHPGGGLDALRAAPVQAYDAKAPLRGWSASGSVSPDSGAIDMREGELELERGLPADFVLEWEYLPDSFDARAAVSFCVGPNDEGYRLSFGGGLEHKKEGKIPIGSMTLAKRDAANRVLRVPHTVDYRLNYMHAWSGNSRKIPFDHPIPDLWVKFQLAKTGRFLFLAMTNVSIFPDGKARGGQSKVNSARQKFGMSPVLIWEDTGEVAGPPLTGAGLRIAQRGGGRWRNIRLSRAREAP